MNVYSRGLHINRLLIWFQNFLGNAAFSLHLWDHASFTVLAGNIYEEFGLYEIPGLAGFINNCSIYLYTAFKKSYSSAR